MKISKLLQIVILSAMVLGLPISGHAQGNLVNLSDWTNETRGAENPNNHVQVISATFAYFGPNGYWSTNGPGQPVDPILTGILDTTPGATYEISYTLSFSSPPGSVPNAQVTFDNCTTNATPPASFDGFFMLSGTRSLDYTVVATSPTTTMSFNLYIFDDVGSFTLSDVSVTAVPEISSARLIGFGACVWLFAKPWRRLSSRRTRT